ncbi:MAG: cupin domain-containing protein [Pseudomonadota bacterium]
MNQVDRVNLSVASAEILLQSDNVTEDLGFFTKKLGFRLDEIFPADDPASILLSGHGIRLRLERDAEKGAGIVRLMCEDPDALGGGTRNLTSPCGTKVELIPANQPMQIPDTRHSFMVRRLKDKAPWVIGRAGMHYRDLIPDRLGGSIIASHIRIPDGGPVPDMVHYHTVGFQLIYCYRGWVDVVYEDQGPAMRLTAGDCVIQPPEIRHRVLEASDNVEVVEIGVPAEHVTTIDHEMELPTPDYRPEREFGGQIFVHHEVSKAVWHPWRIAGFEHRDTGINAGTKGVANVQVARWAGGSTPAPLTSHDTDILFTFVLEGSMQLEAAGATHALEPGDAFVIPPGEVTRYGSASPDLELLEISLPGKFATAEHDGFSKNGEPD